MLTPQQIQSLAAGQEIKYTDLLPYLVGETCTGQVVVCPIMSKAGLEVKLARTGFNLYRVEEVKKLYEHD